VIIVNSDSGLFLICYLVSNILRCYGIYRVIGLCLKIVCI
jgi:hypothetical protein